NRRNTKCIFYHVCNGVTLCTVTDTEAGKTSEQREQNAKPFLFQASFQSIHRTTDHTAVFTFNSVLDSQNSFTIFGSNTEAACQPYPEYRTRTAGCDRCSNADDVTGTDGRCQCSCQRAETGYVTFCFFVGCYGKLDAFEYISLNHSCTQCQEYVCTKQ